MNKELNAHSKKIRIELFYAFLARIRGPQALAVDYELTFQGFLIEESTCISFGQMFHLFGINMQLCTDYTTYYFYIIDPNKGVASGNRPPPQTGKVVLENGVIAEGSIFSNKISKNN